MTNSRMELTNHTALPIGSANPGEKRRVSIRSSAPTRRILLSVPVKDSLLLGGQVSPPKSALRPLRMLVIVNLIV
jgi:hypothetical protein